MRRFSFLGTALVAFLLLAPAALAHDGGQGTIGEADDKIVTNAGFIVIALFPVIIVTLSALQGRLDKRKDQRLAAKRARSTGRDWQSGW
jgi:hypothetical protein